MRPASPLKCLPRPKSLYIFRASPCIPITVQPGQLSRACSCSAPLALAVTNPLNAHQPRDYLQKKKGENKDKDKDKSKDKNKDKNEDKPELPADHRAIGTAQSLFITHCSSPGAPFFQPDGTHIFQKLVAFLRAQYPHFGFREVLTPTMYKEALWEQSGHWTNYKDDMFTVVGCPPQKRVEQPPTFADGRMQPKKGQLEIKELEEYGLKPMNCPGHCLLYKSERRSYRDLPIRYAEFSPLHRNERSGALSGLTRVRRFHQDDGHIFCRPSQVRQGIDESLAFIQTVYKTMELNDYHLVLSTRPKQDYIGSVEEWDRAEDQLKEALNDFPKQWKTEEGEGAFYGPKIDVILRDSDGKKHQTGTIQLDFQLPKRFDLTYETPAPELEAKGEHWDDSESRTTLGRATPVMIHRAVLGSLERFMALLLEHYRGQLPFWLSNKQVAILTVGDKRHVKSYAEEVKQTLSYRDAEVFPRSLEPLNCIVDIDDSTDSIAQKIVRAKKTDYRIILIVGEKNILGRQKKASGTVDLSISTPDQKKAWSLIEEVKPNSRAPVQKDKGVGSSFRGLPGVRLTIAECKEVIMQLNRRYC